MAWPAYSRGMSRNDALMAIATSNQPMRFPGCRAAIRLPTLHIARIATSPAADELLGWKASGTPRQLSPKVRKAWTAANATANNQITTGTMTERPTLELRRSVTIG